MILLIDGIVLCFMFENNTYSVTQLDTKVFNC